MSLLILSELIFLSAEHKNLSTVHCVSVSGYTSFLGQRGLMSHRFPEQQKLREGRKPDRENTRKFVIFAK